MAWTDLQYAYASILTAAKMTQAQDNFTAIAQGLSGAPKFQTPAFDQGPVSQPKLNTTTASGSTSISSAGTGSYTLTGGTYSWWTAGSSNGAEVIGNGGLKFGNGDTAAGVIGLRNPTSSSLTFYVDERYVQASPPYNLGNGDILLFVFVKLDSLGNVLATSLAPDPPWAYHGPTDIAPHHEHVESGKKYRLAKFFLDRPLAEAWTDPWSRQQLLYGDAEVYEFAVEIDHDWKNRDMPLFPHPFGELGAGEVALMLDPFDTAMNAIIELHAHDQAGAAVRELLLNPSTKFTTLDKSFATPTGVVAARMVMP